MLRPEPPAVVTASFEATAEASRQARATTSSAATAWGIDENSADDLLIVVSELVTNAAEHARTPSSVTLQLNGSVVRVAVSDDSPVPPVVRLFDARAARGRGMQMIEALSSSWGHRRTAYGKTVWVDVPVLRAERPRRRGVPSREDAAQA